MLVGTYNNAVSQANGVRSLTVFLIVMSDGEQFAPLVQTQKRPKGRLREEKFKNAPGSHQTPLWLVD